MAEIPFSLHIRPMDTDGATHERHAELIKALPDGQRLMRALALSAFVRQAAWEGAKKRAAHRGKMAVVERFLQQMYGSSLDERVRRRVLSGG